MIELEIKPKPEQIQTNGRVTVIGEAGMLPALYSLTKPYVLTATGSWEEFIRDQALIDRAMKIARKLARTSNGEDKFLRFMTVWLDICAPRYWWAHFDTYKVGTAAQSESVRNKLTKFKTLRREDFEPGVLSETIAGLQKIIDGGGKHDLLKSNLPEGFLQTRVVMLNYNVLKTIYHQRSRQEKLGWWKVFLAAYDQLKYPDFARPPHE